MLIYCESTDRNTINLNNLSSEAIQALINLDKSFIGTENYMGLSYFWNYEYRHWLRDVPKWVRVKIHKEFLKANLNLADESDKHLEILNKYKKTFKRTNRLWMDNKKDSNDKK